MSENFVQKSYFDNRINATRTFDMVLCIDRACPACVKFLQKNFKNFYRDITEICRKKNRQFKHFRIRIVAFHKYGYDAYPVLTTNFYNFPEEEDAFIGLLSQVDTYAIPYPSDGLEGLAYAIKSDWADYSKEFTRKKQLIAVLTSNPTNPIGYGKTAPTYPRGMAKDFEELTSWWNDDSIIDSKAKRLLLFAPDNSEWCRISSEWDNIFHLPIEKDSFSGELNLDYNEFLNLIEHSVAPDIQSNF